MKTASFYLRPGDCRLMTVEILYRMPDHPYLLQTFIWQEYDYVPEFPILQQFLHFWEQHIEGRLHSVQVASAAILDQDSWRNLNVLLEVH